MAGCDSAHTLDLTINNSNTGFMKLQNDAFICVSNTSWLYTNTYTNAAGCDSVHTLNLTISSVPQVVCSWMWYTWDGESIYIIWYLCEYIPMVQDVIVYIL